MLAVGEKRLFEYTQEQVGQASFLGLPDEVMLLILRQLSPKDLARLSMAARRFVPLCKEDSLWEAEAGRLSLKKTYQTCLEVVTNLLRTPIEDPKAPIIHCNCPLTRQVWDVGNFCFLQREDFTLVQFPRFCQGPPIRKFGGHTDKIIEIWQENELLISVDKSKIQVWDLANKTRPSESLSSLEGIEKIGYIKEQDSLIIKTTAQTFRWFPFLRCSCSYCSVQCVESSSVRDPISTWKSYLFYSDEGDKIASKVLFIDPTSLCRNASGAFKQKVYALDAGDYLIAAKQPDRLEFYSLENSSGGAKPYPGGLVDFEWYRNRLVVFCESPVGAQMLLANLDNFTSPYFSIHRNIQKVTQAITFERNGSLKLVFGFRQYVSDQTNPTHYGVWDLETGVRSLTIEVSPVLTTPHNSFLSLWSKFLGITVVSETEEPQNELVDLETGVFLGRTALPPFNKKWGPSHSTSIEMVESRKLMFLQKEGLSKVITVSTMKFLGPKK